MIETLQKLKTSLQPIYGKGESDAIIRLIFHYLKGWNLTDILIHQQDELSPFIKEEIDKILQRLLNQEPIQYITGESRFHGMELLAKPGVLIPRPETEELVDLIIDENKDKSDLRVLDLCTGSGCIALALARNLAFSSVTAVDFSDDAVLLATENSKKLKTPINIIKDDIFNPDSFLGDRKFDLIVSNPPYVMDKEAINMERNVLDYEPHEALFVRDENPLIFYRRIVEIAKSRLVTGGKLYFEINPMTSKELKELLTKAGYDDVRIVKDSFGKDRFAIAIKR
ncbi:MAG: peptide chain release factor N(5)-glutamine methyltransferase [Muribaculaceae bacterium]|nr:peptide chain release factor N(5)-glutamine methyltransferase [Muribaculaceae bacterium]